MNTSVVSVIDGWKDKGRKTAGLFVTTVTSCFTGLKSSRDFKSVMNFGAFFASILSIITHEAVRLLSWTR